MHKKLLSHAQFAYWTQVKRITTRLLVVWIALIFGVVVLVPNQFAYWLISCFLLLSFLGLVVCYAWQMDKLDAAQAADIHNKPD